MDKRKEESKGATKRLGEAVQERRRGNDNKGLL